MMRKTMILTVAALAASIQIAAAQIHGSHDRSSAATGHEHHLAQLRSRDRELAWEAAKTKGAASQELHLEHVRVERLINDLESGRNVDPSEIERALERQR